MLVYVVSSIKCLNMLLLLASMFRPLAFVHVCFTLI